MSKHRVRYWDKDFNLIREEVEYIDEQRDPVREMRDSDDDDE